jgi:hypothetical protein
VLPDADQSAAIYRDRRLPRSEPVPHWMAASGSNFLAFSIAASCVGSTARGFFLLHLLFLPKAISFSPVR